jgi:acyl-CoA hydrolase
MVVTWLRLRIAGEKASFRGVTEHTNKRLTLFGGAVVAMLVGLAVAIAAHVP